MPECSPSTPDNLFAVTDNGTTSDIVLIVASVVATGILAASATVLVRRWRAATKPARRALGPVLFTGLALLAALTALFAIQASTARAPVVDAAGIPAMLAFAALPFAFLAGLLRNRWSRAGAVGELVERLGVERASLAETLADAMGDPTLRLAYWLPEPERFVDGNGRTVALPGDADPARAATMVERDGERIGALVHDRSLCEEPELVSAVAAAAALAMANERLEAELRARLEELSESRARLIETGLAERRRLERDLHDGAQQRLVALSLQLHVARGKLDERPRRRARRSSTARATSCATPSRSCASWPAASTRRCSTDRGLGAAIEALAARAPVPVEVDVDAAGAAAHGRRGGRLLRRRRVPDEHGQARRRVACDGARRAAERHRDSSRSATTASAARRPTRAAGSRASRIGSRRSTAVSRSSVRPGRAPPSERGSHASRRSRGQRPAARGRRAPAAGGRHGRRRPGRRRRGPAAQGPRPQARRRARRHPDAADADRRGPARGRDDPRRAAARPACSCSRSTSRRRYALELLADNAEGVGYLLKDRVADVERFVDGVRRVGEGGSALDPEVVARLVGRRRGRTRCGDSARASARSSGTWRRAARTTASPRRSSSPSAPWRSTSRASSRSSTCPRPRTTIAACSRC